MATYYHVSRPGLETGTVLVPSAYRLRAALETGNALQAALMIGRSRARWREAPLFGARNVDRIHADDIAFLLSSACGAHVWMAETLEDAREIAAQFGTPAAIYEVEADDATRAAEDGVGREWPVAQAATIIRRIA